METLKELIVRLEQKVNSLDTELTQLKATVKDKIKPVIIDIKPAQAKAIPQLTKADVQEIAIELFTLDRINKLYGK